jgi:hypothetical protein
MMKRLALATLFCAAALLPTSAAAQPVLEVANWFNPLPPGGGGLGSTPNTYTVVFKGDQRANIPAQNANDTLVNPFAFLGATTITTSLDGNGNTDIVYQGAPIPMGMTFPFANGQPHFGLNEGTQPPGGFQILSQTWSNSGGGTATGEPAPSLAVVPTPSGTTFHYVIFFAQFGTLGEWFESAFNSAGPPPQIQIGNFSTSPFTLSNAGYFLSNTQIPLDQLNFNSEPPPGQPGSPFLPLQAIDGLTVAPGGVLLFAIPEPNSLILFGVGLLALVGDRSCRGILGLGRRRPADV